MGCTELRNHTIRNPLPPDKKCDRPGTSFKKEGKDRTIYNETGTFKTKEKGGTTPSASVEMSVRV